MYSAASGGHRVLRHAPASGIKRTLNTVAWRRYPFTLQGVPGLKDHSKILPHKQHPADSLPRRTVVSIPVSQLIPRLKYNSSSSGVFAGSSQSCNTEHGPCHHRGSTKGLKQCFTSPQRGKMGRHSTPKSTARIVSCGPRIKHSMTYVVSTAHVTGLCESKSINDPSFIVPADRPREGMPYGAL